MLRLSAMSDTDWAQSASDSLHYHLSAVSDTDYTMCVWLFTLSSVSHVWHWLYTICVWLFTLSSVSHVWHCIICIWLFTLSSVSHDWHWLHNLHLTLYTVMNWCWDRPPCLTLTVHPLAFRFVGRPGKYKTIFGARQEEVSVCVVLGVLVLVITCVVNPPWSELIGAVHAQRTYLHPCT